ncbi:MAG: sulfite exporter TauE/SafE family protein [Polyangiaceae bacterium]|jgi:uncharacterized protein
MSPLTLTLLFFAAALGGALNSVAGGGSFIAFPALLFAGVAPVVANATNTVALWPAGLASAFAYRRELTGSRSMLVVLSAASLVGGIAGAELLLKTSETTFVHLLPWLLLVATVLFTGGKRLTSWFRPGQAEKAENVEQSTSPRALAVVAVVQTVIAVYGGYFGGGMGILMLATLSLAGMTNIHAMNALKTILGAVINGVAVALFIAAGAVAWVPGSVMVVGGIVGGYAGATLARKIAPDRVRTFVGVVAWGMTIYFFIRR